MSRNARIELVPAEITVGTETRRARATESHYLRLVAGNGQVLATSELYANKANAKRAVAAFRKAAAQVSFAEAHGRPAYVEVDS